MRYIFLQVVVIAASLALTAQANAFTSEHCSIQGSIEEPNSKNTPRRLILEYTGDLAGSALMPSEDKACYYYERGLIYHFTGRYDQAIADYTKALGWMSGFGEAHASLGDAYAAKGQPDKAQAEDNEAWRLDQGDAAALSEICYRRALRGTSLNLAVSDCNRAIELDGSRTEFWNIRCLLNYRLARYEAAISDCTKSIGFASALYIRGLSKIKVGDLEGGNADIAAAKDVNRDVAENYAIFGITP